MVSQQSAKLLPVRTDAGSSHAGSAAGVCLLAFVLMERTGKSRPKSGFNNTDGG